MIQLASDSVAVTERQKVEIANNKLVCQPLKPISTMSTYLITGCSQGLGLGYVQYLLSRPASEVALVIATSRRAGAELQQAVQGSDSRAIYVQMDVTSESSIDSAVKAIQGDHRVERFDVLINNAAQCPYDKGPIETM